ncbi:putative quinol monooxygenase [Allorhizobium taibaishanense]|uniref:Antibiotic biosynthesis monooxygenase n=1 Tax=Allorhizobium taibaishanense TaxID=887144 RepID=A0A1Q9AAJ4_9HYPH|nr:putative quinol monooxygenase [Allorhizobium taibaishanense]MBB4007095.1 quinol monooxygenase YgiN [Allorhizobium taibaishanense]OLP51889.1 antibiotic biosynthesis monooxygenase [Allorhizobium taibaishanense]
MNGHIDVPQERLAEVEAALPLHIELTRAEPGCLSFQVTPCPDVPGRFLVAESFADQTSFEAHQARTKASAWFAATQGIARDYQIRTEDN